MMRMVVFDVGETLVDETRFWCEWADWLGVPRFTFLAVLGAVIASGRHHAEAIGKFSTVGYPQAIAERVKAGWQYDIRADDFYPDALPCIKTLRASGFKIGIVGNQPEECEHSLHRIGVDADLMGSSGRWGVEKPSTAFFERLVVESGLPPNEMCYVGDHPENDILPAHRAGLMTVFIRRGPWALARSSVTSCADAQIDTLSELPAFAKLFRGTDHVARDE